MSVEFPDWLTISVENFDYRPPDDFSGLNFESAFIERDTSQFQSNPTCFDEAALLQQLRANDGDRSGVIPATLCAYCLKHFSSSFMDKLNVYLTNVKALNKLIHKNKEQRIMTHFDLKPFNKLNFGYDTILQG